MKKGDLVFSLGNSGLRAGVAARLASSFGLSQPLRGPVGVAIASGLPGQVFEASPEGMIRRQLLPGNYRLYSYRGEKHHEIRRIAVVLAQAFACNWIEDADFAEDGRRRAVLSVFRDAIARNDDHDHSFWHPGKGPASAQALGVDGSGAGERPHGLRACRLKGAALIDRCYHGAFEALALPIPALRHRTGAMKASDLEHLVKRDPHWHARNKGQSVVIG